MWTFDLLCAAEQLSATKSTAMNYVGLLWFKLSEVWIIGAVIS